MSENKQETEEQIFDAACRVFQQKGYAGARMQEIADEADINKSMLHYYYRSKDKLFQKVFQKEMSRFFPIIFGVMASKDPLYTKIKQLVEAYYSFLQDNPHMPQFIILEMNQHPERFESFIREKGISLPESFILQIEAEVKAGKMNQIEPRQLLVSMLGVILFPFLARTMVQTVFKFDDAAYQAFLRERKDMLAAFILNAIGYTKS